MQATAPDLSTKPKAPLTPNPGLTPMMLNHAAWVTPDAAATTDFYTRIMGMELASTVLDDSSVTSQIKRVRAKFAAIDPAFAAIETVYGMGYRWNDAAGGG